MAWAMPGLFSFLAFLFVFCIDVCSLKCYLLLAFYVWV